MRDLSPTWRRDPLVQHVAAELWGNKQKPTPAHRHSPGATSDKQRVQPFSRSWVPEPKLWVEVRPTMPSRYLTTSCTSSSSFRSSEVTSHVPIARGCFWGPGRLGPWPRLRPVPQSTRPLRPPLPVVSPQGSYLYTHFQFTLEPYLFLGMAKSIVAKVWQKCKNFKWCWICTH